MEGELVNADVAAKFNLQTARKLLQDNKIDEAVLVYETFIEHCVEALLSHTCEIPKTTISTQSNEKTFRNQGTSTADFVPPTLQQLSTPSEKISVFSNPGIATKTNEMMESEPLASTSSNKNTKIAKFFKIAMSRKK